MPFDHLEPADRGEIIPFGMTEAGPTHTVLVGTSGRLRLQHGESLLDGMWALRHAIFHGRLKWIPESPDGRDVDGYDDAATVYGIAVNRASGAVEGTWRVRPTTQPYMLADIWPELLHGAAPPRDPDIWEISRLAVARGGASLDCLVILLRALFRFGRAAGIESYVACSDTRFEAALRLAGMSLRLYGPALDAGRCRAVAGWADVAAQDLRQLTVTRRRAA